MIAFKFSGTTDRDLGYRSIMRELDAMRTADLHTGLFEGDKHPGTSFPLASIGAVHEYGSPKMRIPERSWLRRSVIGNGARWRADVSRALDRIITSRGKVTARATMIYLGELFASDVRKTIDSVLSPPKAASTLRKEGARFTHPLIWLGYMRASVRSRITMGGLVRGFTKGGSR